jgi:hypothetical protein
MNNHQGSVMKMSLRRTHLIGLLALLFLLSGCTTIRLSDEDRKKINVIKISSNVVKVPNMYYMGPGTSILLMGGVAGGVAAAAVSAEPKKALQDYAEKNGILIEKIALEEIDAAFRQSGKVKVADSGEPTEATLYVTVTQWGFSIPNGFSSNLVPVVSILCGIRDATDKVVWMASDHVHPLGNPVAPMSLEAIRDNPKLIEDAWRRASRRIATNIVKRL